MSGLHTLLVPYDFSDRARAALSLALELAEALGADLHLLHVVEQPVYAAPRTDGRPMPVPDAVRQHAEDLLRDVARESPRPIASHVVDGVNVADCVVVTAKELGADMIVIGTQSREAFTRLLRRAPCPVLSVRAGCGTAAASSEAQAGSRDAAPASAQLETLSDALARLVRAGFHDSFNARDGKLFAEGSQVAYEPEDLVVREVVRFEGESDPADSAVLFALRSRDGRTHGTFVVGYGTATDAESASVVSRLTANHAAETRGREHLPTGIAPARAAK